MISSIRIEGLRGIREGAIEGLAPLTMIVGPNGCGKTTVLEALGVACAGQSAKQVFEALAAREWLGIAGIEYWFDDKGADVEATFERAGEATRSSFRVHLERPHNQPHILHVRQAQSPEGPSGCSFNDDGVITGGNDLPVRLSFALQANFVDRPAGATARFHGGHFSSALRNALTSIKKSSWYDDWFKYLQELRPNVTSIESIAVGDRDEPHLFESNPRMGYPLADAGDGFRRALLLAGTFARAKGGVAAVDEPELIPVPC